MANIITPRDAAEIIPEGSTIMVGGFMGCGNAHRIVAELAEIGTSGLTLICNDGAMLGGPGGEEYYGVAKLIHSGQVVKLIASHVGLNPEVGQRVNDGSLEAVIIPQGSLAEMIRAGGAGLGGVLTPTGLGTIVQDADHVHSVVEVDGVQYLLERPIRADYALICGYRVDKAGNVWYKGTTRNFNQVMATAADTVIVEAENLVEIGEIAPEDVVTQGILVDYIAH